MYWTQFYIKNFRNIGNEGALLKIAPISFLTGCNSAGKSSVAKAILLLDSYLSDLKSNDFDLNNTPLDFSKVPKLGSFDSVLNIKSKENGFNNIVLGFSFQIQNINDIFHANFTFEKRYNDSLNSGWLKELSISTDTTELFILKSNNNKYYIEFKDKDRFIKYYSAWMIHEIRFAIEQIIYDHKLYSSFNITENTDPHELLDIYWALKDAGYIDHTLNTCEKNHGFIKRGFSQNIIIGAVEQNFSFGPLEGIIYEFEYKHKKRVESDDIDYIIKNFINLYKSRCRGTKFLKESTKEALDELQLYISSDSTRITDRVRRSKIAQGNKLENWINKSFSNDGFNNIFDYFDEHLRMGFDFSPACFVYLILFEALKPTFNSRIGYIDSSTVNVKRLYSLDSSDDFGNLCKKYNNIVQCSSQRSEGSNVGFMKKWLKEFGICDNIIAENIEGTVLIKLISEDMPEGRLLADYGYGITQLVALLMKIEIASNSIDKVIPFFDYSRQLDTIIIPYTLIIEEPEVHLHPSFQSKLADMFYDASTRDVHFIIETHSEYLIRHTQVLVANRNFSENDIERKNRFKVYYFPNNGIPYDMKYQTNGHFQESFGSGFFDEAGKWTRGLIRTKAK